MRQATHVRSSSSTAESASASAEENMTLMQKIKHGGITVKEGSVAIWDQMIHQTARLQARLRSNSGNALSGGAVLDSARERRQEARAKKDVLIGIPAAVAMVVIPGSALLLAVVLKYAAFLLPSTYLQARGALRTAASVKQLTDQLAAAATASPAVLVSSDTVHRVREQLSSELLHPTEDAVKHLLKMLHAPASVSAGSIARSPAAASATASGDEHTSAAQAADKPSQPLLLCGSEWLGRSFGLVPHIPYADPAVEAAAAAAAPPVESESALVPSAGTMLLASRQLASRIALELCERATAATQALAAAEAAEKAASAAPSGAVGASSSAAAASGSAAEEPAKKRGRSRGPLFVLPPRLTASALSASGGAAAFSELAAYCSRLAQDDWLLRRELWLSDGLFAGLPADDDDLAANHTADARIAGVGRNSDAGAAAGSTHPAAGSASGSPAEPAKPLTDKQRTTLRRQLQELTAVCAQRFLVPAPVPAPAQARSVAPAAANGASEAADEETDPKSASPAATGASAVASSGSSHDGEQLVQAVRRLQRGLQAWLHCSAAVPLPLMLELSHSTCAAAARKHAASAAAAAKARPAVPLQHPKSA